MHIYMYLKNIPAKVHPNPIWNDGALGFFEQRRPNNNNCSNNMSGDMRFLWDQFLMKNNLLLN